MKRTFEPIDLAVAVGVFATVICGYLMFAASTGIFQPSGMEAAAQEQSSAVADGMQWVQPVLGRAIVDETILERKMADDLTRQVRELNRASMAEQRLRATPFGFVDRIRVYATGVEGDHGARMQWVMGRVIVNATARGVRTGVLSAQHMDNEFNRALISQALSLGAQMDEAFRTEWQDRLGSMIVTASEDYLFLSGENQERIGRSIVGVAGIQEAYQQNQSAVQAQLASAAIAAVHGEQIAERFAHLATEGPGTSTIAEPQVWPEVPAGLLVAGTVALVGIFLAGIVMPLPVSTQRMQESERQPVEERYRKTA